MQCRQAFARKMLEQRILYEIDVEMDKIILIGVLEHAIDHCQGVCQVIVDPV